MEITSKMTFLHVTVASSAWIGLNDLQTTNFYQWADNSDVTFTGWDAGQPVAAPGVEQHCIALNREVSPSGTFSCHLQSG